MHSLIVRSARSDLPSGIVTFVFTDIEGSTRLFRRLGPRYVELLERHNELLRFAWEAHNGHEISTEGDAFFVAFAEPADAIAACADGQRMLLTEPWPQDGIIRVRMGVHSGVAYPRSGDYVAFAVHQAARVVSAGHGGQILVSEQSVELLPAGLPLSGLIESVGRFRLRDFDDPVRLFQVVADGIGADLPAIRARQSSPQALSERSGAPAVRPPTRWRRL